LWAERLAPRSFREAFGAAEASVQSFLDLGTDDRIVEYRSVVADAGSAEAGQTPIVGLRHELYVEGSADPIVFHTEQFGDARSPYRIDQRLASFVKRASANKYLEEKGKPLINDVRIPADVEWAYAAMGGFQDAVYPWHSKMIDKTYTNANQKVRNHRGCFLANFCLKKFSERVDTTSECYKVKGKYKGAYTTAGFMLGYEVFTVPVYSYNPNDYGLYCMSGNVAEWTSSIYYEGSYTFQHDMNPDVRWNAKDTDPPKMKRKVIRGGSWKDVGYYLQTGTRTYEYQDSTKSYIGFRTVIDLPAQSGRRK
jgi:hypothetical protein